MLVACPFCGPRALQEYQFLRLRSPPHAGAIAAVFGRDNAPDHSVEYWQHGQGCRAWLELERNPSTAEVLSVRLLAGEFP